MLGRASRDLARALVERDGFELELLIDVDGLEDVVRSVEDNKRIARDVCLASLRISHGCVSRCVCGRRTMIWFPSHRPWVTACSLACGRPGSMPRMNYLKAFATRASSFRECQKVESFALGCGCCRGVNVALCGSTLQPVVARHLGGSRSSRTDPCRHFIYYYCNDYFFKTVLLFHILAYHIICVSSSS
jgi:hypothetical protein